MTTRNRGTGTGTRLAIFAQVALSIALAAAVAGLVTWLSARPALRRRFDLTTLKTNTLDASLGELIAKLPERASVDVFFRPLDPPLAGVGAEAQRRMRELLAVARNQFPDQLRVEDHEISAETALRARELDIQEDNVVVVELQKRRVVLRLLRDIARVNPGNPSLHVEPSLESFRGEEAFGSALLRVAIEETPQIVFTKGHGERDPADPENERSLGHLQRALAADGFAASTWNGSESGKLPPNTRVVAIVDPQQPLRPEECDEIARFVDAGGSLFVAPTVDTALFGRPNGAEDLLKRWGIVVQSGFVAAPVPDISGHLRTDTKMCGVLEIPPEGLDKTHPVTESLRRGNNSVLLPLARAFKPGPNVPKNSRVLPIVRSGTNSWGDLTDARGEQDWHFDESHEETGPFELCIAAWFPPPALGDAPQPDGKSQPVSKIVALGCPDAFNNRALDDNRDFALNVFNWLAAREQRLVVRPRSDDRRILELRNTSNLAIVNRVVTLALPGLFAALGIVLALRRRK
jgi:hypothetical protein